MTKRKYLHLTEIVTVISEKGEEKIKRIERGNSGGIKRDSYGRSAENYEDMGLPVPEELLEKVEDEIDSDGNIELVDDEFEYVFNDCLISLDSFDFASDHNETGSFLYFKRRRKCIHVEETVEEIYAQIWYLNRTWKDKIEGLLERIKNKFKKESTNTQIN